MPLEKLIVDLIPYRKQPWVVDDANFAETHDPRRRTADDDALYAAFLFQYLDLEISV